MAMHLNQGAETVHDIKPELERKVLVLDQPEPQRRSNPQYDHS